MLLDSYDIEDDDSVEPLTESMNKLARTVAEEIERSQRRVAPLAWLASRSGYSGQELEVFVLRVRYHIQKGWKVMVNFDKGGLHLLTEEERAAEAARRCRLGARKVERADRALKATRVDTLTPAQRAEHENAQVYVSRLSRSLRSAQRIK